MDVFGQKYDTDSTCGTSDGDLVKKTDAAGNVTCYGYDALHRVTSITYPSGPNSANSPNKCFVYDAAIDSEPVNYPKARLAEAYTTTSACSKTTLPATITDEAFSYTPRGELTSVWESTPHSGGYFNVNETYWANGLVNTISGLPSMPTLTYAPDGEGRVNTVSASSGQNPVTATTYNSASEATQLTFGSTDTDAFTYDPNTFRMTQYQFNIGGKADTGALTWNANWSLGSLQLTDGFNSANNQTCSYSADDLARIASVSCGSQWAQTFGYDAFGNIQKSGSESFQPNYSYTTNRMTQIGSFTPTYDADGDVTNDDLYTYTWDSNGRPVKIGNEVLIYDAVGRMVEQDQSGGTYVQFVYDPLGNKLGATSNTSTLTAAFAPLPAGDKVQYNSSGLFLYEHGDWLGSWRNASTPTRSRYYAYNYAPFGEEYPSSGSPLSVSFAGMDKDTAGQLYDAANREYTYQGRWPSPDPAGIAAANPANPQSWNRYAYVMNNPLLLVDPFGLSGGVSCFTVEAMPQRSSQQSADGPFDPGYEEPPQQNGCPNRTNPFGVGSDGVSLDWGDATDLFGSNSGIFGSGASIGGISMEGYYNGGAQIGQLNYAQWCGPDTYPSSTPNSVTVKVNCSSLVTQTPAQSTAWSLTVVIPQFFAAVPGPEGIPIPIASVGPAITTSFIPSSMTVCGGVGYGAAVPYSGRSWSVGPLIHGNTQNTSSILSGWSSNGGAQVTPGIGYQVTRNSSGSLGGPSVGSPGFSASVTYSVCHAF